MKTLTNLWRRYIEGCQHHGFFIHGDNEMRCAYCGYVENLR